MAEASHYNTEKRDTGLTDKHGRLGGAPESIGADSPLDLPNIRQQRRGRYGRTVPDWARVNGADTEDAFLAKPTDSRYAVAAENLHEADTGWFNPEVRDWSASDLPPKVASAGPVRGGEVQAQRSYATGGDPYAGMNWR